jgi:hypothetical protein
MACRAGRKIPSARVPFTFLRMARTRYTAFMAPMNLSLLAKPCLQGASGFQNQDIAELYSRVPLGSKVIVLSGENAIALHQRDID